MKRIQGLPKISDLQFNVQRVSGETLSYGNNIFKNVIRGINSVIEVKSNSSQGIQVEFKLPIRKTDSAVDTVIECFGGTPGIGVGGGGHSSGKFTSIPNSICAIASGGINPVNPYATPTSYGSGGGGGSGFGGFFNVPLSNPSATLSSNAFLVAGGSGGSSGAGRGAGGGTSGGSGRPSGDPRSLTNAAGGSPSYTAYRFTGGRGNPPQSGNNNNTPGGGSGGAGYYGGYAGAQGVDGGSGTRGNNGGGGGSGYVSPLIIGGQTTPGLPTTPAGRSSVNYSTQINLPEPVDGIKSKVIIMTQF